MANQQTQIPIPQAPPLVQNPQNQAQHLDGIVTRTWNRVKGVVTAPNQHKEAIDSIADPAFVYTLYGSTALGAMTAVVANIGNINFYDYTIDALILGGIGTTMALGLKSITPRTLELLRKPVLSNNPDGSGTRNSWIKTAGLTALTAFWLASPNYALGRYAVDGLVTAASRVGMESTENTPLEMSDLKTELYKPVNESRILQRSGVEYSNPDHDFSQVKGIRDKYEGAFETARSDSLESDPTSYVLNPLDKDLKILAASPGQKLDSGDDCKGNFVVGRTSDGTTYRLCNLGEVNVKKGDIAPPGKIMGRLPNSEDGSPTSVKISYMTSDGKIGIFRE